MARYNSININLLSSVAEAYRKAHPDDELGKALKEGVTLSHVLTALIDHKDIYGTIFNHGYSDSLVRERIFTMLSKVTKLKYDIIHDLWIWTEK